MVVGEVVAGQVRSVPARLSDGRIRLADHWRRLDGSTGVSYIEEHFQAPDGVAGRPARPPC